jgi:hypothetical protein
MKINVVGNPCVILFIFFNYCYVFFWGWERLERIRRLLISYYKLFWWGVDFSLWAESCVSDISEIPTFFSTIAPFRPKCLWAYRTTPLPFLSRDTFVAWYIFCHLNYNCARYIQNDVIHFVDKGQNKCKNLLNLTLIK